MRRGGVLVSVALAVCLVAPARRAWAWGTTEHQELGTQSYLRACAEVTEAAGASADARVRARLEMACGPNLPVVARIYGDGTAIAGDFVGHPSELLSPTGAWRFSSPKHYYLLALENSAHFNPMATESWREYHQDAVNHALVAAAAQGLPLVEAFESAVRESAFADHHLQDSFAAGHMGFNRRASSAAAAKRFHDTWNERGRVVYDRLGRSWTTFGDGRLDEAANAEGRRHVLDAATASVRDLLLTFVLARRHPDEGLTAWRSLPFTIEAPELLVDAEELVLRRATARDTTLTPLVATVRPARKNTVVHAKTWAAAPFSDSDGVTAAATADVELAIPVLPAQCALGAGGTYRQPDGRNSLVLEGGLLAPLGLSIDGLLSHELEARASVLWGQNIVTIVHVEYQANLELGTSLLTAHLGLAEFLPAGQAGWFAAFGYGFTFSAAGGGAF